MDIDGLIIFLGIGALAGWLAGTLMEGGGFGIVGNIAVGILGAVIGGGFIWRIGNIRRRVAWLDCHRDRGRSTTIIYCKPHQAVAIRQQASLWLLPRADMVFHDSA